MNIHYSHDARYDEAGDIHPDTVLTDYKKCLRNVILNVWPTTTIRGGVLFPFQAGLVETLCPIRHRSRIRCPDSFQHGGSTALCPYRRCGPCLETEAFLATWQPLPPTWTTPGLEHFQRLLYLKSVPGTSTRLRWPTFPFFQHRRRLAQWV